MKYKTYCLLVLILSCLFDLSSQAMGAYIEICWRCNCNRTLSTLYLNSKGNIYFRRCLDDYQVGEKTLTRIYEHCGNGSLYWTKLVEDVDSYSCSVVQSNIVEEVFSSLHIYFKKSEIQQGGPASSPVFAGEGGMTIQIYYFNDVELYKLSTMDASNVAILHIFEILSKSHPLVDNFGRILGGD